MPCFYAFLDYGFFSGWFIVCASENIQDDYEVLCEFYDKKNLSLRFVYPECIEYEIERFNNVIDTFDVYFNDVCFTEGSDD